MLHHQTARCGRPSKAQQSLDKEEEHGDEEGGQQIDGFAILDVEHTEASGGNQNASDDADLRDEFFRDEGGRNFCNAVDAGLPSKDKEGRDGGAETIAGGHDNHCHEVERGGRHEIGVVVEEGAQHGAHHRERSDATEQDTRGDAFCEVGTAGNAACGTLQVLVELQESADEPTDGQAEDEENGIVAFDHVFHGHIDAEDNGGEAHSGVKNGDVFLAYSLTRQSTNSAADNDGNCI